MGGDFMAGQQRHTVFVVDDSRTSLVMLKGVLRQAKTFDIITAGSAEEALRTLEDVSPDIFLLDVMMPGIDGYELCQRLKADERHADVPVMFITGQTETEDLVKGLDVGAVDYITKPFNRAEVLARVRTHLRLFDALREIERLRQLALDANPLTKLPGNESIKERIQASIDERRCEAVVYGDLDNFKPYNDRYGFSAGDQVIKFAAGVLQGVVEELCGDHPERGFVGHVGGDDFVVLLPAEQVDELGRRVVKSFDEGILAHYDEDDRERRCIVSKSRQGDIQTFPIMGLSMAGLSLVDRSIEHHLQVANVCAEVKKEAKARPGTNLVLDRRRRSSVAG